MDGGIQVEMQMADTKQLEEGVEGSGAGVFGL